MSLSALLIEFFGSEPDSISTPESGSTSISNPDRLKFIYYYYQCMARDNITTIEINIICIDLCRNILNSDMKELGRKKYSFSFIFAFYLEILQNQIKLGQVIDDDINFLLQEKTLNFLLLQGGVKIRAGVLFQPLLMLFLSLSTEDKHQAVYQTILNFLNNSDWMRNNKTNINLEDLTSLLNIFEKNSIPCLWPFICTVMYSIPTCYLGIIDGRILYAFCKKHRALPEQENFTQIFSPDLQKYFDSSSEYSSRIKKFFIAKLCEDLSRGVDNFEAILLQKLRELLQKENLDESEGDVVRNIGSLYFIKSTNIELKKIIVKIAVQKIKFIGDSLLKMIVPAIAEALNEDEKKHFTLYLIAELTTHLDNTSSWFNYSSFLEFFITLYHACKKDEEVGRALLLLISKFQPSSLFIKCDEKLMLVWCYINNSLSTIISCEEKLIQLLFAIKPMNVLINELNALTCLQRLYKIHAIFSSMNRFVVDTTYQSEKNSGHTTWNTLITIQNKQYHADDNTPPQKSRPPMQLVQYFYDVFCLTLFNVDTDFIVNSKAFLSKFSNSFMLSTSGTDIKISPWLYRLMTSANDLKMQHKNFLKWRENFIRNNEKIPNERRRANVDSFVLEYENTFMELYHLTNGEIFNAFQQMLHPTPAKYIRFIQQYRGIDTNYYPHFEELASLLKQENLSPTQVLAEYYYFLIRAQIWSIARKSIRRKIPADLTATERSMLNITSLNKFKDSANDLTKQMVLYIFQIHLDELSDETIEKLLDLVMAQTNMAHSSLREVFSELLLLVFFQKTRTLTDYISQEADSTEVSKQVASHNRIIREILLSAGIAVDQVLDYARQVTIEHTATRDAVLENPTDKLLFQAGGYLGRIKAAINTLHKTSLIDINDKDSILNKISSFKRKSTTAEEKVSLISEIKKELVEIISKFTDSPNTSVRTLREFLEHLTNDILIPLHDQSTMPAKIKDGSFTIQQWDKNRQDSFFLGNMLECCLATNGTHFEAMIQRLIDQAMMFHVVMDAKDKPICGNWLFLARDSKQPSEIYVVANFYEINRKVANNRTLMMQLVEQLTLFTAQYAVDIGAIGFLIRPLEYGSIPDFQNLYKVSLSLEKIGGFINFTTENESYYLEALDSKGLYNYPISTPAQKNKILNLRRRQILPDKNMEAHLLDPSIGVHYRLFNTPGYEIDKSFTINDTSLQHIIAEKNAANL